MMDNNDIDAKEYDSIMIDKINSLDTESDDFTYSIQLYNLFISSNQDYLYNKTYILDSLDKFKDNIESLKKKKSFYNSFLKNLNTVKSKTNNENWVAIIDDYYIITFFYSETLMSYAKLRSILKNKASEFVDCNNLYNINKASKFVNCNNLYNINKDSYTLRIFYMDCCRLFAYHIAYEKTRDAKTTQKLVTQLQNFIDECDEIYRKRMIDTDEKNREK